MHLVCNAWAEIEVCLADDDPIETCSCKLTYCRQEQAHDSQDFGRLLFVRLTRPSAGVYVAVQGAVTIAIRYGAQRQQFGPPEGEEIAVLDYQSLQWCAWEGTPALLSE